MKGRVFSPTDRAGRKSRPGSPEEFDRILSDVANLLKRFKDEALFRTVYEMGYGNLKSSHPTGSYLRGGGKSDPTLDTLVDPRRARKRSTTARAHKTFAAALADLRGAEKGLRQELGLPTPGRPRSA